MTDDHPEIPTEAQDGRYIDWGDDDTCSLCGSPVEFVSAYYPHSGVEGYIECKDSGEVLFMA